MTNKFILVASVISIVLAELTILLCGWRNHYVMLLGTYFLYYFGIVAIYKVYSKLNDPNFIGKHRCL
jgi:hypothetical protein